MPPNHLIDSDGWCWVLWWSLAINIIQVVITDFSLGHYYNACAGFWLVLAMPRKTFGSWDSQICWFAKTSESWSHILFIDESFYDMVYETDWFWVIMYTSWNLCFCFDARREHFAVVCIVLIASLVNDIPQRMKSDPHLWTQAYIFILLVHYSLIAIYDPFQEFADTSSWFDKTVKTSWGVANLTLTALYSLYKLKQTKATNKRRVITIDSADTD